MDFKKAVTRTGHAVVRERGDALERALRDVRAYEYALYWVIEEVAEAAEEEGVSGCGVVGPRRYLTGLLHVLCVDARQYRAALEEVDRAVERGRRFAETWTDERRAALDNPDLDRVEGVDMALLVERARERRRLFLTTFSLLWMTEPLLLGMAAARVAEEVV